MSDHNPRQMLRVLEWHDATAEEICAAEIRKGELRRQLAELQRAERGLVDDAVVQEDRA